MKDMRHHMIARTLQGVRAVEKIEALNDKKI